MGNPSLKLSEVLKDTAYLLLFLSVDPDQLASVKPADQDSHSLKVKEST